ncbi:MAG: D-tyrosyl-tRNA(Tyr) deacylase [Acidobacteria bacterium]|nr:MAG: D-tyrosyl-tRNA(Tyr) deacylase [Acidobacteriota bacterium]
MKVLVQRVLRASVRVGGEEVGSIGRGLLVFLGVESGDDERTADWYARRVAAMKWFPDESGGLWRKTVGEVGGAALVVSQFTLAARTRKGRRPSFDPAAPPERAEALYRRFLGTLRSAGVPTSEGRFGARMEVELVNDGPVTFLLDGPGCGEAP